MFKILGAMINLLIVTAKVALKLALVAVTAGVALVVLLLSL